MLETLGLALPFAQAQAAGGIGQILFMLAAFGGIVYFLMIRPQQQQRKKHEEMINGLKRGEHVIMQGGLYGKIKHVHDETFDIEIAPDVVVKQSKQMILALVSKPEPQAGKKAGGDKAKTAPKRRTSSTRSKASNKQSDDELSDADPESDA